MASNLTLDARQFAKIHEIREWSTVIVPFLEGGENPRTIPEWEVHLDGRTIPIAAERIMRPGLVGTFVWMRAASRVGRPSGSKALIVGDSVYWVLSWTDVLGSGHGREGECKRQRDGRYVAFLRAPRAAGREVVRVCRETEWERRGGFYRCAGVG